MDDHYLKNVVEAALLAAGRPLSIDQLRELFEERERPETAEVRKVLTKLHSDYAERGIELKETASGFRIQVRSSVGEPVARLWQERPARYSRALLETLALIAYRQPITRGEIEEIRGVGINPNIVRTLFERNWIRVVGHREVPGHPELLGTTREFLDYFNLKTLDELPALAELRDMDNVGVQLELPGESAYAAAGGQGPSMTASYPEADEQADIGPEGSAGEEEESGEDEESAETLRTRGMVARGSED
jgi:segregation and condensation protein B